MPFTPFHFGPATLLKAIGPRYFSLVAFVASQVVIDVESGYHLVRREWPVHRLAHTLPIATLVGVVTGVLVWLVGRRLTPSSEPAVQAEARLGPALLGGFLGGATHPVLDGIMHHDVHPFWPLTDANPLLSAVSLRALHLWCFATGVLGAGILMYRWVATRSETDD